MTGIHTIVENIEGWFSSPQWLLWLLRIFNSLNTAFESLLGFLGRTVNAAKTIVGPQLYYCFYGYPIPLSIIYFDSTSYCSARYEWIYDAVSKYFYCPEEGVIRKGKRGSTLPILGMEILDDEKVVYDLTEFIEDIRIFHRNNETAPSIAHLLGAWSLSSGIILNMECDYKVRVMTVDADILEADAFSIQGLHEILKSTEASLAESKEVDDGGISPALPPSPPPSSASEEVDGYKKEL